MSCLSNFTSMFRLLQKPYQKNFLVFIDYNIIILGGEIMREKCNLARYLAALFLAFCLLNVNGKAANADPVDWQDGYITVTGMGVSSTRAFNATQARMMARRAAQVDCYRQLAEAINGVNVDSESTVENFMLVSDVTKTKVQALIHGAQIVSEREISGGYEMTMRIPMYGAGNSLAGAVMPATNERVSFPEPDRSVMPSAPAYDSSASVNVRISVAEREPSKSASSSKAIGGYTGLIVDCRGLGLKPMMSPVIKNDSGNAIYGHRNLNPDYVIKNGMAGYTRDLNGGNGRAGSNPLVVRALRVENHGGYPVVSAADANRILIENQVSGFLDQTKVVFVR